MITSKDIYDLASTAQAAYADLIGVGGDYTNNLLKGVDGDPLFSAAQAKAFVTNWRAAW